MSVLLWPPSFAVGAAGVAEANRRATQGAPQAKKSRQQALATAQPQRPDSARVQAERRGAQAHRRDKEGIHAFFN